LVGAQHVLVVPQRLALPPAGVQVEHGHCPLEEVRIARKEPTAIAPWPQRVLGQQPPQAGARGGNLLGRQLSGFGCAPGVAGQHAIGALGEDSAWALRHNTESPTAVNFHTHCVAPPGQIKLVSSSTISTSGSASTCEKPTWSHPKRPATPGICTTSWCRWWR